jgi:hypothetical protein
VDGGAVGPFLLASAAVAIGFDSDEAGNGLAESFWTFDWAKAGSICGNNLAIFSDGRGSGTGILRPRSTGSRLLGTSMTKCMLCLSRPDTLPA